MTELKIKEVGSPFPHRASFIIDTSEDYELTDSEFYIDFPKRKLESKRLFLPILIDSLVELLGKEFEFTETYEISEKAVIRIKIKKV